MKIVGLIQKVSYSSADIKALIEKDLKLRGLLDNGDKIISFDDFKKTNGTISRGPFDEDPIYVFAGINISIEKQQDQ